LIQPMYESNGWFSWKFLQNKNS